MKRLVISIALVLLVFGASVFELLYVCARSDEYADRIDKIEELIYSGDNSTALKNCEALEKDWDGESKKIYTLLIHDYVDSVGNCLSKMRSHLENNSLDMYFAESTGAKKALASIKGSEYPYYENIL